MNNKDIKTDFNFLKEIEEININEIVNEINTKTECVKIQFFINKKHVEFLNVNERDLSKIIKIINIKVLKILSERANND